MNSVVSAPEINSIFNLPDVQQFLKLLKVPEVQTVFNTMVEKAIALSELNILKRIAKLEVHTGLDDPEDEDHPITMAEQIYQLTERIDNKTEPIQETVIEPRTSLEFKATEFAIHVRDVATKTGKTFLKSKEIMHFLKEELSEPLRMKDIQNPRQVKRDVLQKAKAMFPFITLDRKKNGRRDVRVVYKPENDSNSLNRMDAYIRLKPT